MRLDKENVIDLISLDNRVYKTESNVLGVLYYENMNKTSVGFSALEFSAENGDFSKKPLWEVGEIREGNVSRFVELSDGNILLFVENHA